MGRPGPVDDVPRLPGFASLAGVLLLGATLMAGCSEPPEPTKIELFAFAGVEVERDGVIVLEGEDGSREVRGPCGTEARYETHLDRRSGTLQVTVTDGAGKATEIEYTDTLPDKRTIEGSPGQWTLRAQWTGYAGAIHVGLTCP